MKIESVNYLDEEFKKGSSSDQVSGVIYDSIEECIKLWYSLILAGFDSFPQILDRLDNTIPLILQTIDYKDENFKKEVMDKVLERIKFLSDLDVIKNKWKEDSSDPNFVFSLIYSDFSHYKAKSLGGSDIPLRSGGGNLGMLGNLWHLVIHSIQERMDPVLRRIKSTHSNAIKKISSGALGRKLELCENYKIREEPKNNEFTKLNDFGTTDPIKSLFIDRFSDRNNQRVVKFRLYSNEVLDFSPINLVMSDYLENDFDFLNEINQYTYKDDICYMFLNTFLDKVRDSYLLLREYLTNNNLLETEVKIEKIKHIFRDRYNCNKEFNFINEKDII